MKTLTVIVHKYRTEDIAVTDDVIKVLRFSKSHREKFLEGLSASLGSVEIALMPNHKFLDINNDIDDLFK